MAGATADILVSERGALTAVDTWSGIVSRWSQSQQGDRFWIASPNEAEDASPLPFFWDFKRQSEELWVFDGLPGAAETIRMHFGFRPFASIGVGAMCRGRPSDQVLARLTSEFLATHEGVLLFHGLLAPTLNPEKWRLWDRLPPAERASEFEAQVGHLGGRLIPVPADDEPCYHAADATFLQQWMSHAEFHFVN